MIEKTILVLGTIVLVLSFVYTYSLDTIKETGDELVSKEMATKIKRSINNSPNMHSNKSENFRLMFEANDIILYSYDDCGRTSSITTAEVGKSLGGNEIRGKKIVSYYFEYKKEFVNIKIVSAKEGVYFIDSGDLGLKESVEIKNMQVNSEDVKKILICIRER